MLLQSVFSKQSQEHQQHCLRKGIGCIITVLLLCVASSFASFISSPYTGVYAYNSMTERNLGDMTSQLELRSGSFLTYELKLVWLRFTNGSIIYSGPGNTGLVYLNVSFLEAVTSDEFLLNLDYLGSMLDSSSGIVHVIDTSFNLQYSIVNGAAKILNGTLKDTEGRFSLLEEDSWIENDNFTISTGGNTTIFAKYMASNVDVGIRVMGELQIVNDYNCTFLDPFTNITSSHIRSYDKDRGVLLEAPYRFADPILLGGINILSIEGRLSLIKTNIDLGPPVRGVALDPSLVLIVSGVVVFVISYSIVYRAQARKGPQKRREK